MGNRLVATAAVMGLALVAVAPNTSAQPGGLGPETINGQPNLSGVWQAMNVANWNLEAHSAEAIDEFWRLGALAAVPAGQSVVDGGTIPYTQEGLVQRDENRAGWPEADPETLCYLPGIPRANYMPYPFQIFQGENQFFIAYQYAGAVRNIYSEDPGPAPIDSWMGQSVASWEGDTLVLTVTGQVADTWFDRAGNFHSEALVVEERYTLTSEHVLLYEATMTDTNVFTRPWTIRLPLYRRLEPGAQLLEFKCVEFAEELMYGHLVKQAE